MLKKNESSGTRKKLLSATTLQREQFGRHQRKEAARQVSRPSINNSLETFEENENSKNSSDSASTASPTSILLSKKAHSPSIE